MTNKTNKFNPETGTIMVKIQEETGTEIRRTNKTNVSNIKVKNGRRFLLRIMNPSKNK